MSLISETRSNFKSEAKDCPSSNQERFVTSAVLLITGPATPKHADIARLPSDRNSRTIGASPWYDALRNILWETSEGRPLPEINRPRIVLVAPTSPARIIFSSFVLHVLDDLSSFSKSSTKALYPFIKTL